MDEAAGKAFRILTGGGLLPGVLTQVYGPPGSGKTNLALIASVLAASSGRVVYVDPEGGFSTERLRQIAGEGLHDVLGNILLVEPTTFDEQKQALKKLDELVPRKKTQLVVLDSVALLYRVLEDKDIREYGRMLAQLLRVARKYDVAVLMTNQVYTDIEKNRIVPVGGQINEYWSKVIIELGLEGDRRFSAVRKHLHHPTGGKQYFRIVDEGFLLNQ